MRFLIGFILFISLSCFSYPPEKEESINLNVIELNDQYNFMKKCAEKNDIECQYKLFKFVIKNEYLLNEHADYAFKQLINAGMNGHLNAQFDIGSLYQTGILVEKDADAALTWLLEASSKGHVQAMYLVGSNYENRGVESKCEKNKIENWNKAIEWYSKANDLGFISAKRQLGVVLLRKDINSAEGDNLIMEAAIEGDGASMRLVGLKFKYEWKKSQNEKDLTEAVNWYQKSVDSGYKASKEDLSKLIAEKNKIQKSK